MITEVLLVLPLYLILFYIWWRFQPFGNILNDDDVLRDTVDTPKEDIGQHKKREELNSYRGKLGHKWTHERVNKESNEVINKTYTEYKQRGTTQKGEKTAEALGKHVIKLYSNRIPRFVKIRDVKKLRQEIEDDPLKIRC